VVTAAVAAVAGLPDAGLPDAPIAAPADAAAPAIPADAAPAPIVLPAPAHAAVPPRNLVAEEHLRNAEDGFQTRNQLKQLAEADLALRADPRSVRARFLLGDALIKSGDLDRGCAYLHTLKRYPPAHDRAHAAGCPGD